MAAVFGIGEKVSELSSLGEVLGYVGPAGALGIILVYLFIRSQREDRQADREHRLEMEGRRTTDIEQIVKGWDKSSEAMTKVCEETRQAVLQVHLSVKETTSAMEQSHQSNRHDHELLRESIKDLAQEQRLRSAQHTPVHSPAYRGDGE